MAWHWIGPGSKSRNAGKSRKMKRLGAAAAVPILLEARRADDAGDGFAEHHVGVGVEVEAIDDA